MEARYIANDQALQALTQPPNQLLQSALERVIRDTPPSPPKTVATATLLSSTPPSAAGAGAGAGADAGKIQLGGLLAGPTSYAYLFFQIAARHPNLLIQGLTLLHWSRLYLADADAQAEGGAIRKLMPGNCGILSEKLAYEALRACISKQDSDVQAFLSNIPALLGPYPDGEKDPFECELLYGRAGALHLLRLVKHNVPNSAASLEKAAAQLSEKIISLRKDEKAHSGWTWFGSEYFGTAHGTIGIIAQLVLTTPSLAPSLSDLLASLLDLQKDGNWPTSRETLDVEGLVQWCFGAPGFINALKTVRPYFTGLHERIDTAVAQAEEVCWERGLLTKEPSVCHGILGNALTLPKGPRRDHFLALATPEAVALTKETHAHIYQPADFGLPMTPTFTYHTSAAWTWAVCEEENPGILGFTDM